MTSERDDCEQVDLCLQQMKPNTIHLPVHLSLQFSNVPVTDTLTKKSTVAAETEEQVLRSQYIYTNVAVLFNMKLHDSENCICKPEKYHTNKNTK